MGHWSWYLGAASHRKRRLPAVPEGGLAGRPVRSGAERPSTFGCPFAPTMRPLRARTGVSARGNGGGSGTRGDPEVSTHAVSGNVVGVHECADQEEHRVPLDRAVP